MEMMTRREIQLHEEYEILRLKFDALNITEGVVNIKGIFLSLKLLEIVDELGKICNSSKN